MVISYLKIYPACKLALTPYLVDPAWFQTVLISWEHHADIYKATSTVDRIRLLGPLSVKFAIIIEHNIIII